MSNVYYELREARDAGELLSLFRWRYRIYHETRMAGFSFENGHGLDLNCFDLRARHVGLFLMEEGISRSIGYQRAVGEIESPLKHEITRLIAAYPAAVDCVDTTVVAPLPVMSSFPKKAALNDLYWGCAGRGELMMEDTKFCIEKMSTTLQLARFMAEAEMAIHFFFFGVQHALACVHVNHEGFYSRLGFTRVPGTTEHEVHGLPMVAITLSSRSVPALLIPRLREMAAAFGQTGRVCFNPSDPKNFYTPGRSDEVPAIAA